MSVCLSVTVTSVLSSGSSAGSCRVRSASRYLSVTVTSVLSSGSCHVRSAWRCLSVCHCDVCPVVRFMSRKERLEMSVCLSVTVTSVLSSGSSAGSCHVRSASRCLSVCHCDVCPVVRFMSRKERLEMSVCLSVTVTSVLSSGSSAGSCRVRSAWRCLSVTVTSVLSSGL